MHTFTSMRQASHHYPTNRGDGKVLRSSCQDKKKKSQKFPCFFEEECFIDNTDTSLKLSLDRWYHEIGGDWYPCECGRRFRGPIDAAYHLFWSPQDPESQDHRCGGSREPETAFLAGLDPTSFPVTRGKSRSIGYYKLNFKDLATTSTETGPISATLPIDPKALAWVDRNSTSVKVRIGSKSASRRSNRSPT
jgi:hypothetical protein